jgi:hypothetical protein
MWQGCWVSEWVQSLFCAKHGQQIRTRSGGDAHHAWSCGNDVVAHCLYTGMHSVAANSRDKHFLVLIGSLGKEERLTFLTEEQWRQRTAQTQQIEGRSLDDDAEHPVTSMCRTEATKHITCLTVLRVLREQLLYFTLLTPCIFVILN